MLDLPPPPPPPPHTHMLPSLACYGRLFRLRSITGALRSSTSPRCRLTPTLTNRSPLLLARKLTMHSSGQAKTCRGGRDEPGPGGAGEPGPELCGNIPSITTEDTGPPLERRRKDIVFDERNLRTPSPLFDASGDDDSEAESYRGGRTEGVDRDTRSSAFAWCRDFLSGSWKTIPEEDFEITIVR